MKKFLLLAMSLLASLMLEAQDMIQSYVINIEDGKAYLAIAPPKVKVGDVLSIREEAGYMIHPVTKKKIKKEGAIFADLEIVEVHGEYSVATIYPEEAIKIMKVGMIAEMPELTQRNVGVLQDDSEMHGNVGAVEEEALQVVPTDADGIVHRYLQVTGLDKWMNKSSFPPFYKKEQLSYTTKKGKGGTSAVYSAFDISAKKLYFKFDNPKLDLFFFLYSKVIAVNGYEGWFSLKKGKATEIKPKDLTELWGNQSDAFGLQIYDTYKINLFLSVGRVDAFGLQIYDISKWDRSLSGKRMIKGKTCSGIVFVAKFPRNKKQEVTRITQYFDDNTGLIAYSENNLGVQSEHLLYKQFGNMILCSQIVNTYANVHSKSQISEESIVLQELCFDCPLDNFLFTKEGVKQSFK